MSSETTIADDGEVESEQPDGDDRVTLDPDRELSFVLKKRDGKV